MPLCAAAMSEGTGSAKSAPAILTTHAADSNNSCFSGCTAESAGELEARLEEIRQSAAGPRSGQAEAGELLENAYNFSIGLVEPGESAVNINAGYMAEMWIQTFATRHSLFDRGQRIVEQFKVQAEPSGKLYYAYCIKAKEYLESNSENLEINHQDSPMEARVPQIEKSAAARSLQDMSLKSLQDMSLKSYGSAVTAECEQELAAQIECLTHENPSGLMNQQVGTGSFQPAFEPWPAGPQTLGSAMVPTAVVLVPAYPVQVQPGFAFVGPACWSGSMATSSHMPACGFIDLEATMPTGLEASAPTAPPARKRNRSRHLTRASIGAGGGVEAIDGPSRKRQQKAAAVNTEEEVQVTEKEWQDRFVKRQAGINNMRSSPIYYEHQDIPKNKRPRTPDVFNRNFSKRQWEEASAKWRVQWRQIDGVRWLLRMGYPEKDSLKAWQTAGDRIKKAQDKKKLEDKNKKHQHKEAQQEHKDHKASQNQAHHEHKRHAVEILEP